MPKYQIKKQHYHSVAIPDAYMAHISDCTAEQLRVASFMLCTDEFSLETISSALNISTKVVSEAISYWISVGLIEEKEIVRTQPNAALAYLIRSMQYHLGRPLTKTETQTIVILQSTYGFPVDFVEAFLKENVTAKQRIRDCDSCRKQLRLLSEQGIADLGKYTAFLEITRNKTKRYEQVAKSLGIPTEGMTRYEKSLIDQWFETYKYTIEIVELAVSQVGIGNADKISVRYINSILKQWNSKGYRTVRDITNYGVSRNALPPTRQSASALHDDILVKSRGKVPVFSVEDENNT